MTDDARRTEANDGRTEANGTPDTARSLAELGAALGLSKTRAFELTREPWFPARGAGGWSVPACLAVVARWRRGELTPAALAPAPAAPPPPSVAPLPGPAAPASPAVEYLPPLPGPNPLDVARAARGRAHPDMGELAAALERSTDPLEIARVAARVAAQRYAHDPDEDAAKTLHGSLETWRKMENDALELARRRGDLIERDAAKACIGAVARRFVLACDRLVVRLAAQVELWLADEAFRRATAEERARVVRAWATTQTRQARLAETEEEARAEVEKLVAAEIAERGES